MKKQKTLKYDQNMVSNSALKSIDTKEEILIKKRVGIIAIVYATTMFIQNMLFAITESPGYNDSIEVVLSYHAENQGALALTSGLEAINMVLLLFFITSLNGLISLRGDVGKGWSQLAVSAGVTLSALFALFYATHISVIVASSRITEPNMAFEMMWQLHAAVFALAMPALGLTFISTALATHASGLTRSWQRNFGVFGGILPILAGLGNLSIAGGSSFLYIGVIGLFLWLLWLIITGVSLIREKGSRSI